jgi:hypothetical protein
MGNNTSTHTEDKVKPKEEDYYLSPEGFNTCVWGPSFWHVLHTISFNYPIPSKLTDKDKINYYKFIMSIGHVLPCGVCRSNYRDNIVKAGLKITKNKKEIVSLPPLQNRHTFSKFIYKLHQEVSKMKLSVGIPCTYEEMRKTYELFRAKCRPNGTHTHGGCEISDTYIASKGVVHIMPQKGNESVKTFIIDKGCYTKKSDEKNMKLIKTHSTNYLKNYNGILHTNK